MFSLPGDLVTNTPAKNQYIAWTSIFMHCCHFHRVQNERFLFQLVHISHQGKIYIFSCWETSSFDRNCRKNLLPFSVSKWALSPKCIVLWHISDQQFFWIEFLVPLTQEECWFSSHFCRSCAGFFPYEERKQLLLFIYLFILFVYLFIFFFLEFPSICVGVRSARVWPYAHCPQNNHGSIVYISWYTFLHRPRLHSFCFDGDLKGQWQKQAKFSCPLDMEPKVPMSHTQSGHVTIVLLVFFCLLSFSPGSSLVMPQVSTLVFLDSDLKELAGSLSR